MKWLSNLFSKKLRNRAKKSINNSGLAEFEIGKRLYLSGNIEEALYYTDLAINRGFDSEAFVIRGCCLQELKFHYDAINDFDKAIQVLPNYQNYFSRSISKAAILDYEGQLSDVKFALELTENTEDYKLIEPYMITAELNFQAELEKQQKLQSIQNPKEKLTYEESLNMIEIIKLKNVKRR